MIKKKAITLFEAMVIVIALGALAVFALPGIVKSATNARASTCATNINIMNSQIELHAANNNGSYPPTLKTITKDPDYFAEGPLKCPFGGKYKLGPDHKVTCGHKPKSPP